NEVTTVKASAGCVWRPKKTDLNNVSKENSGSWVSKRVNYIDPQGNKDFITDYQDIDGGFVAFGRSARGEFKNREMNEFCGLKGIKKEFSVSRTLKQNGVTERKNMTLIEAARTMLVDLLLPAVFWVLPGSRLFTVVIYKSSDEKYKNDTADDAVGETPAQKLAINVTGTPRTSNDARPLFVPLGRSFPFDVNDLPDDPLMPDLD
ncbi:ribonuclease H-like domain-containing protein, partial [Tanacetum coccineum]